MSLKYRYQTKEEVPAEIAGHYREQNGAWVLEVEGAVERGRVEEMRATNAALTRERDELKERFETLQSATWQSATMRSAAMGGEGGAVGAAPPNGHASGAPATLPSANMPVEVERVLEARVKGVRGEMEKQIKNLTSERDALNQRLVSIQIDQGVLTTATKRGLRATALPDITARARNVFRLVNGVPTAFEADGQTVRVGKDGFTAMSLEEWMDGQVSEAPHLFEGNAGGGAGGAAGRPGAGRGPGMNPWRKETWNLTEQMRMMREDPAGAARMRSAECGVRSAEWRRRGREW